jgi:hypothetical protein
MCGFIAAKEGKTPEEFWALWRRRAVMRAAWRGISAARVNGREGEDAESSDDAGGVRDVGDAGCAERGVLPERWDSDVEALLVADARKVSSVVAVLFLEGVCGGGDFVRNLSSVAVAVLFFFAGVGGAGVSFSVLTRFLGIITTSSSPSCTIVAGRETVTASAVTSSLRFLPLVAAAASSLFVDDDSTETSAFRFTPFDVVVKDFSVRFDKVAAAAFRLGGIGVILGTTVQEEKALVVVVVVK